MSKEEGSSRVEKIKDARDVLRHNIPKGINKDVDEIIEQIDELLWDPEDSWSQAFWVEARKKLESLSQ